MPRCLFLQSWLLKWLKKGFVLTRTAVPRHPSHLEPVLSSKTGPCPSWPAPFQLPQQCLDSRGSKTLQVQSPRGASDERPTTQEIATASAETARVPVTCASHTAAVSPHSCRLVGRRKIRFLHPRHRRQWRCRCCCLPGTTSAVRHWVRGRCLASGVPRL